MADENNDLNITQPVTESTDLNSADVVNQQKNLSVMDPILKQILRAKKSKVANQTKSMIMLEVES